VNAALSLVYGLTRAAVHGATHAAGLDPYCGYLHGDRDGQPSLVLDLMEEFRPAADRFAVSLINRRQLRPEHFLTEISGAVQLTDEGTKVVFDAWHKFRQQEVAVAGFSETVSRAMLPIIQANTFANALRSKKLYRPHRLAVQ
jgi:CRISPR-associated protein Cas1